MTERRVSLNLTTRELEDINTTIHYWLAEGRHGGLRRQRLTRLQTTLRDVAALAAELDPEPPAPAPEEHTTSVERDCFADPVWRQEFARLYGAPRRNTGRRNHG